MIFTPQKEAVRGKILYYLALIYPQAATLPVLQGGLDDLFGCRVPMHELESHLAYLGVRKLVSRNYYMPPQRGNPRSVRLRKVAMMKITAKGLDYYDGRLPADPGIYLEPK